MAHGKANEREDEAKKKATGSQFLAPTRTKEESKGKVLSFSNRLWVWGSLSSKDSFVPFRVTLNLAAHVSEGVLEILNYILMLRLI